MVLFRPSVTPASFLAMVSSLVPMRPCVLGVARVLCDDNTSGARVLEVLARARSATSQWPLACPRRGKNLLGDSVAAVHRYSLTPTRVGRVTSCSAISNPHPLFFLFLLKLIQ